MRWPYTPDDHAKIAAAAHLDESTVADMLTTADNRHGDWDGLTPTQAGRKIIRRLDEFVRNP